MVLHKLDDCLKHSSFSRHSYFRSLQLGEVLTAHWRSMFNVFSRQRGWEDPDSITFVSDSHPAFFLPIATTSNNCNNCKWEMQMLWIRGQGAIKRGCYALSAFPSFIKPGTRQTGLTGRFQKSFDMNSWHLLTLSREALGPIGPSIFKGHQFKV